MLHQLRILMKSTAVRLSALYILLFAFCAAFLVIYVAGMSANFLREQTQNAIAAEVEEISHIYEVAGMNGLVKTLERRSRQPGANLYVIAGPSGDFLAGNVAAIQPGILGDPGWTDAPFRYERFGDENKDKAKLQPHMALADVFVLPNGLRVLVGRDLGEPEHFKVLVRQALVVALGVMGIGALVIWFFIGRNALSRIARMSDASAKIMAGDLSQRLPVGGSGDEFDRMSVSLNSMLGRIEKLNEGLKQVSDNIAHDLKTPLTRIRNKATDGLSHSSNEDEYRQSLEGIIAESDQLIRTFNALLMISRVEAGSSTAEMNDIDLSAIAADSAELYEPVLEEAGLSLKMEIEPGIHIHGNRELVGQALFNLLDNAVKYAGDIAGSTITVSLSKQSEHALLTVADEGPGIPAHRYADAVQRFVRIDESRSKPGTGLGLSMVEAVAALHGGSLELAATKDETAENKGLTVRMLFPLVSA
ncbi:sensor histidine kinase [Rhizobium sp. C1]|uniref:sensor histidine kinase n=1 Tax=Rhizobium sp. C1 TaxID=1349799 RepID=UPI001E640136|nr:ATP-binding protein [Rhizobium sp. C1]MCD2177508.1 HAMP domain-containing histidine kinase [Rhizobium sp. C1]